MKPFTSISTAVILCLAVLYCAAFFGCNKSGLDVQMVEGKVTLDGTPLEAVVLTFVPEDGGTMGYAKTDAEGNYKLTTFNGRENGGTTVGTYKVQFEKTVEDISKRKNGEPNLATVQVVPKKYLDAAASGFTVKVQKGKNTFNFDLLSK